MRIAILSPFYPYRGGIAQFSAMLYNALTEKGNTVKAFNFKKLYPDFLFPGKTQYVEKEDTAIVIESDRCLNSINIYSYAATLKHIKNFHPDILIISYWMSFFAPEYAYIAHGSKFAFTIEKAPIATPSPTLTLGKIIEFAPTCEYLPICTSPFIK